ncbi:MAG: hypothetical protein K1X70_19370 [Leptospirales bacterium]|nr:hypothetical protein [Leptospirales bacterium]
MRHKEKTKFFAEDFWKLIESQKYRCALTGIELTPNNTELELKEPYKEKGRAEFCNHYLVTRAISFMARHIPEQEIIDLAIEIVKHRGKERGYGIKKIHR